MKWLGIGGIILGAAVAAWWLWPRGFGDLTAAEAQAVQRGLIEAGLPLPVELVAPVRSVTDPDGKLVCGWARSGGALGNRAFLGLLTRNGFGVARVTDGFDGVDAVKTVCAKSGMFI